MNSILKNKKGNANLILLSIMVIISGFGMLTIGSYIVFAIASALDPTVNSAQSSGTLTLTGNSSCGEWVNVTQVNSTLLSFYINVTGSACTATPLGAIEVLLDNGTGAIPNGNNTSMGTATQLFATMNANGTFLGTLIATNPSDNVTVITYNTAGVAGNGVITSETLANGSWASGGLTGGVDAVAGVQGQGTIMTYVTIAFPLFGLALMVLGFTVLLKTLQGMGIINGGGRS